MLTSPIYSSLTRISDLPLAPFTTEKLERDRWSTGDYVIGEVIACNAKTLIELCSGRMTELACGDHLIGALGVRAATLEATGHWQNVGSDLKLDVMTGAGLLGKATSVSTLLPNLMQLAYCGHIVRDTHPVRMLDFADHPTNINYDRPTILLIGTSMSSGKTTSGKIIVRELVRMGRRVVAAKFTGAGRRRDTLVMQDAGAAATFDFVDAGLPSTVCTPEQYRPALQKLLGLIQRANPDVVVAEAGASPLEPYNGDLLVEAIREQTCCTVLCASDPYAVLGVSKGFGFDADLVSGVATSTSAGVAVIEKLTGMRALNLLDASSRVPLREILERLLP